MDSKRKNSRKRPEKCRPHLRCQKHAKNKTIQLPREKNVESKRGRQLDDINQNSPVLRNPKTVPKGPEGSGISSDHSPLTIDPAKGL